MHRLWSGPRFRFGSLASMGPSRPIGRELEERRKCFSRFPTHQSRSFSIEESIGDAQNSGQCTVCGQDHDFGWGHFALPECPDRSEGSWKRGGKVFLPSRPIIPDRFRSRNRSVMRKRAGNAPSVVRTTISVRVTCVHGTVPTDRKGAGREKEMFFSLPDPSVPIVFDRGIDR